jgi:hypothetical protein
MADMGRQRDNLAGLRMPFRWLFNRFRSWRRRPPAVGVREPRRPKPTLPAAAVALAEPRTRLRRRVKLTNLRHNARG